MQPVDLIKRLSPEERTELLRRRLNKLTAPFDDQMLADRLTSPWDLNRVFMELNAFQDAVLRWLTKRPGLEAPWSVLLRELHDRTPSDYVHAQMRDLRLWGLLDYDPSPDGGFVATYGAVANALPRKGVRLAGYLAGLTGIDADQLRRMCVATGHRNPPTRKQERVGLLVATMRQPEAVANILGILTPLAQRLFRWIRDHGGEVSARDVQSHLAQRDREEVLPVRDRPRGWAQGFGPFGSLDHYDHGTGVLEELVTRCLVVPVAAHPGYSSWYMPSSFVVPEEVEDALAGDSSFDSSCVFPPKLVGVASVGGQEFRLPSLVRDIVHLLGFVASGLCEWRQDGGPYDRSIKRLGKMIGAADEGYADRVWSIATASDKLRAALHGNTARRVLPRPVDQRWMLETLFQDWIVLPAVSPLGPAVSVFSLARVHFLQALRAVPPDTWITKLSFQHLLAFSWPRIFGGEGQSVDLDGQEELCRTAELLFLETGKTPDGEEAIRVPTALQEFLSGKDEALPALLPPWEDGLVVQPDRSVIVPPNVHPDTLLDLWDVADLESNAGASVFRITRESVARALNAGMSESQITKALQQRSKTPVPPTVTQLISDQGKRYGQLHVGEATAFVRSDDPDLLQAIVRERRLQGLRWRPLAPGAVSVTGIDAWSLFEALRKAGHLPVLEDKPTKQTVRQDRMETPPSRRRRRGRR